MGKVEGYMEDGVGRLVPEGNVTELDKLRDELVRGLVAEAEALDRAAREFDAAAFARIASFVELAAQEHGVRLGGEKGNVTLTSYDGSLRVVRAQADVVEVNEAMTVARKAILSCVDKWSEGANKALVEVVRRAFEADSSGRLPLGRVLSLKGLSIDDPDWARAMAALDDAVRVTGTRQYVRFYRRPSRGARYEQLAAWR